MYVFKRYLFFEMIKQNISYIYMLEERNGISIRAKWKAILDSTSFVVTTIPSSSGRTHMLPRPSKINVLFESLLFFYYYLY